MAEWSPMVQRVHAFFSKQLFYPLLLSSALAVALFAARVLYSDTLHFRNLVWNLGLAWVPYLCSLWVNSLHLLFPGRPWLLLIPGGIWLLFFPNAPYLITDFLHLEPRPGVPLWFDILMLATFAWTGVYLAVASLRTVQMLVARYLGSLVGWAFASASLSLGGLGIYLGRFSRFNSWDLILQPLTVVKDVLVRVANPLQNPGFYGFTILFTAFLAVVYLFFTSTRKVESGIE